MIKFSLYPRGSCGPPRTKWVPHRTVSGPTKKKKMVLNCKPPGHPEKKILAKLVHTSGLIRRKVVQLRYIFGTHLGQGVSTKIFLAVDMSVKVTVTRYFCCFWEIGPSRKRCTLDVPYPSQHEKESILWSNTEKWENNRSHPVHGPHQKKNPYT